MEGKRKRGIGFGGGFFREGFRRTTGEEEDAMDMLMEMVGGFVNED